MADYLLLGGEGFIGRALSRELARHGHHVTSVDSFDPQVHGSSGSERESPAHKFHLADISMSDWSQVFGNSRPHFDAVFFLVSRTGTTQSMWASEEYVSSNLSPLAILHDMYSGQRREEAPSGGSFTYDKVILTSSRAVYASCGRSSSGELIGSKEDDLPSPVSIYGATKLGQEALLRAGFPGCSKVILRLQNVYGPGQSMQNLYTGVVAAFVARALTGKDLILFSREAVYRDFIFIDDVVQALLRAGTDTKLREETINVGTGKSTSIREVAETIAELANRGSAVNLLDEEIDDPGLVLAGLADCSYADELGMTARTPLAEGLMRTLSHAMTSGLASAEPPELADYVDEIKRKLQQ